MNQEYNLGVQLRKRYINIILIKVSNVLSNHTNRTVVSAQSLLMGLYTQLGTGPLLSEDNPAIKGRFQPIPIMTLLADSRLIQFPYE